MSNEEGKSQKNDGLQSSKNHKEHRRDYFQNSLTASKMKAADCAAKRNTVPKDKGRESLHMLQPSAKDKENLVAAGRMLRSAKQTKKTKTENVTSEKTKSISEKTISSISDKSKEITFEHKGVQTARGEKIKIEVEDLTSLAGPSENYWEVVAERRQIALDDAYEKITTLKEQIEKYKEENQTLKEENRVYEATLKETRTLVEVLQDMIEGDSNGINNSLDDSTY